MSSKAFKATKTATITATGRTSAGEAWARQYEAIFGGHPWGREAVIAISGPATGWKADVVPLSDPGAAWRLAENRHQGRDVFFRVSPITAAAVRGGGRGKATDGIELPALFIDVDTADGAHKTSKPLPTTQQALGLVRAMGEPTLVVRSGGGLHAYFRLTQQLSLGDVDGKIAAHTQDALDRWAVRWDAVFAQAGFGFDRGVARDAARVLRMAGTSNGKTDPPRPVLVESVSDRRVTSDEVFALCPPPRGKANREAREIVQRAERKVGGPVAKWMRQAVPVSVLMEQAWDIEDLGNNRWVFPREDGSVGDESHGQTWHLAHFNFEVVTAFGQRLQDAWGQQDERHSLSSWDLLLVACRGDVDVARSIAGHARKTKNPDGLVEQIARLVTHQQSED